MEVARFIQRDESFICENCGEEVKPLGYTSRDHCPHCLHSKHVDINPGDRQNTCKGLLVPFGIINVKKGTQLVSKCDKCGEIRKNIVATDDNTDLIIKLSANPVKY